MATTEIQPSIKTVKPINFLFYRTETKVTELSRLTEIAKGLFAEATALNLTITGPVHWHYFGFKGDETKPFTLEIALPVARSVPDYDGRFHFKRTESFRCVSMVHEGNWFEIPRTYSLLMKFISENNLKAVAINREIYVNADFENPEANVTEVQVGIH